jgi:hypothetical protein
VDSSIEKAETALPKNSYQPSKYKSVILNCKLSHTKNLFLVPTVPL